MSGAKTSLGGSNTKVGIDTKANIGAKASGAGIKAQSAATRQGVTGIGNNAKRRTVIGQSSHNLIKGMMMKAGKAATSPRP
jgi:hypothetical protein